MKLHDLIPNAGSTHRRKRVARGISAGQGKTAGRGTKGQGARQGGGPSQYFQGGNLPFFRKLPFKRGFSPLTRVRYQEVNLDQLTDLPKGTVITPELLVEAGLVKERRPAGGGPRTRRDQVGDHGPGPEGLGRRQDEDRSGGRESRSLGSPQARGRATGSRSAEAGKKENREKGGREKGETRVRSRPGGYWRSNVDAEKGD